MFNQLSRKLLIFFIKMYQQLISGFFPAQCRFYPSCSSYSISAIQHKGIAEGIGLSLKRILKCHPWHPGGVDEIKININKEKSC